MKIQEAFEKRIHTMTQKGKMLKTLEKDLATQERLLAEQKLFLDGHQKELDQKESTLHNAAEQVQRILL